VTDLFSDDQEMPLLPTPSPEDAEGEGELWEVINELFGPLEP
jgi:hypothetical protein